MKNDLKFKNKNLEGEIFNVRSKQTGKLIRKNSHDNEFEKNNLNTNKARNIDINYYKKKLKLDCEIFSKVLKKEN